MTTLKTIAKNVQLKLLADLNKSQPIEHSGTKGNGTEATWISLFGDYLPTRFRVSKGIIIDCNGETSQQIDCVIFDSQYTPQIIPDAASLYIPAEAVHAVFEVKQTVNKTHLEYAAEKVKSVRDLERTSSSYIGDGRNREPKPVFHIIGGLLALSCEYSNKLSNPTLLTNLSSIDTTARLDFVFSAEDGYADLVKSENHGESAKEEQIRNDGNPFIVEGEAGISYGLIRLLEELSWQGTVQAVEWPRYLNNIASPKFLIPQSESG